MCTMLLWLCVSVDHKIMKQQNKRHTVNIVRYLWFWLRFKLVRAHGIWINNYRCIFYSWLKSHIKICSFLSASPSAYPVNIDDKDRERSLYVERFNSICVFIIYFPSLSEQKFHFYLIADVCIDIDTQPHTLGQTYTFTINLKAK